MRKTFALAFISLGVLQLSLRAEEPHFNPLIDKLSKGYLALGLYVTSLDPTNALGIINANGFKTGSAIYEEPALDYLLVEKEHESYDLVKLRDFMLALNTPRLNRLRREHRAPIAVIVNFPVSPSHPIQPYVQQLLDIGVHGIKAPDVRNADQARLLVAACRYPPPVDSPYPEPRGQRHAYAPWAWHNWGMDFREYERRADVWPLNPRGELMVMVHIEHEEGVQNIEEILDVPGISGVTFGGHDFSHSIGIPGQTGHARVQEAFARIKAAADARGIPLQTWVDHDDFKQRIEEGYRMLIVGADANTHIYSDEVGPRGGGEVLRRMAEDLPSLKAVTPE